MFCRDFDLSGLDRIVFSVFQGREFCEHPTSPLLQSVLLGCDLGTVHTIEVKKSNFLKPSSENDTSC